MGTSGVGDFKIVEEHLSNVQENVFQWYKQADFKAQVLLASNGAFLSFIVAMITRNVDPLEKAGLWLGVLMVPLAFSTASSLFSMAALWSRGVSRKETGSGLNGAEETDVFFFGRIARHQSPADFLKAVLQTGPEGRCQQLARNVYDFSRNTAMKHRCVDYSAICLGLAIISLGIMSFIPFIG